MANIYYCSKFRERERPCGERKRREHQDVREGERGSPIKAESNNVSNSKR